LTAVQQQGTNPDAPIGHIESLKTLMVLWWQSTRLAAPIGHPFKQLKNTNPYGTMAAKQNPDGLIGHIHHVWIEAGRALPSCRGRQFVVVRSFTQLAGSMKDSRDIESKT
jgi:hypothetical protein